MHGSHFISRRAAAGYLAGRRNCYQDFERFHNYINIGTLYYPTASQVRSLGKAMLDPDKIIVVVGGSSILHGSGQRSGRSDESCLDVFSAHIAASSSTNRVITFLRRIRGVRH